MDATAVPGRPPATTAASGMAPFRDEVRALTHNLVCWRSLWLALVAAGLVAVAFQFGNDRVIEVGGSQDGAFLQGFHAPEKNPEFSYRWTQDRASVYFPAVGLAPATLKLVLSGARPSGSPPVGELHVLLNGATGATIRPEAAPRDYTVSVPAAILAGGALTVELETETFTPPRDPRALGVVVEQVSLTSGETGSSVPIVPALPVVAGAVALVLVLQLLVARLQLAPGMVWAVPIVSVGVAALSLVQDRPNTALAATVVVPVLAVGTLLARPVEAALQRVLRIGPGHADQAWRQARYLYLALLAGAAGLLGGVLHPAFLSSDLGFHAHRLQMVAGGRLLFAEPLPGPAGTLSPYPPAYYLLLAPLTALVPDSETLLKLSSVVVTLVAAVGVALLAHAVAGWRSGAWLAAGLYLATPVVSFLFTWGNHTNIFGQTMVVLFAAAAAIWLSRGAPAGGLALLVGALALIGLLSHFGVALTLLGLLSGTTVALLIWRWHSGEWARFGIMSVLVIGLSVLLYYQWQWDVIKGLLQATSGNTAGEGLAALTLGDLWANLLGEARHWRAFLGWPALILGTWGLLSTFPRWRSWPGPLLLGWLGAALVFAGLGAAVGLSTRYELFVLPVLAAAAASLLRRWSHRGRAGQVLAVAAVAWWTWTGLSDWVFNVLNAYH